MFTGEDYGAATLRTPGLVAYWPMASPDELVADHDLIPPSGQAGFGAPIRRGSAGAGVLPGAVGVNFDAGDGGWLWPLITGPNGWTIEAWVVCASTTPKGVGIVEPLYSGTGVTAGNLPITIGLAHHSASGSGGGRQLAAGFYAGAWSVVQEGANFPVGVLQHVVGTCERLTGAQSGQSRIRIYRNGQQVVAAGDKGAVPVAPATPRPLVIGRRHDGGGNVESFWNGSISDVAIYSRPLSDVEVRDRYIIGSTFAVRRREAGAWVARTVRPRRAGAFAP